ncbi:MAG: hypothetical protein GC164_11975 [Phycisphaera sp.]|nr:hypothetical protein [Phycisphaera sp.]
MMLLRRALIPVCLVLWAVTCSQTRADGPEGGLVYLDSVTADLRQLEADLPMIARSAEAAAARYVRGAGLVVEGDEATRLHLSVAPGGLASFHGQSAEPGDVVLYVIGPPRRDEESHSHTGRLGRLRDAGCLVIVIASRAGLTDAGVFDAVGRSCDILLDTHANGVLQDGRWDEMRFAPRQCVAQVALAWAWQCEFFAACTRLNRTPVMRMSQDTDTQGRRAGRYANLRYHYAQPCPPIPPEVLGKKYLKALRGIVDNLAGSQWRVIDRTVDRCVGAMRSPHGRAFVRVGPGYSAYHVGGQLVGEYGPFTPFDHDGSNPDDPLPGEDDSVLALGFNQLPGVDWGESELLRGAGRGVCWAVNGCFLNRGYYLKRGELFVDLGCPFEDAAVWVRGDDNKLLYDAPLGATSGFATDLVWWTINAELAARLPIRSQSDTPGMLRGDGHAAPLR